MDISSLKGFLDSLAKISRHDFHVYNGHGVIYSSVDDRSLMEHGHEFQRFSERIMKEGSYLGLFNIGDYDLSGVPLRIGDEIVASLITYGPDSQSGLYSTSETQRRNPESFLRHLSELIHDKWISQHDSDEMTEKLSQSFSDLYLYNHVAIQLRSLKFSGDMLKGLMKDLLDTMRVDLTFAKLPVYLEYNVIAAGEGIPEKLTDAAAFVRSLIMSIPETEALPIENYFSIADSSQMPGYRTLHPDRYRFLAVKLKYGREFYGWLGMVSFNMKEIFRRSELSLMVMMAEQIAAVIANSELYRNLEKFVINVVKSLVHAIEAKDVYTRGHSERVNRYCMQMADRLNMEEDQKEVLRWASILHDIGKIAIPEAILNKPDRLSDEEYDIIKHHPQKGTEILEPIEQLRQSLPGILHHHERYDGKGYPHGLKGEEIPFIGRIIAVADTFDAMTSNRAYRFAKSPEKALSIIGEVAGSQLDPNLSRAFKELVVDHNCSLSMDGYVS